MVLAGLALAVGAACRPATVEVVFQTGPGATYTHRHEVQATVWRAFDGADEEARTTTSVIQVSQRVLDVADDGSVRAEVSLTRDGGAVSRAVVRLDRAGSLAGVDLLDGLPAEELGLRLIDGPGAAAATLPPQPVGPGQAWEISEVLASTPEQAGGAVTGWGRVDRLSASGGHRTLVVTTDVEVEVATALDAARSRPGIDAAQRSAGTTAYDLADGAVRWSEVRTTGIAAVQIPPPPGVDAAPVRASLRYEIEVRTRRR
jgi:hypothetical protein